MDILLKKSRLADRKGFWDIAITNGRIVNIACNISQDANLQYDLSGKLVIPGFVDMHTHLEKVLTSQMMNNKSGTLGEAIENFGGFFINISEEQFYERAKKVVELAIANGTTAIRSHVTVDKEIKLTALRALLRLKKDFAHLITLQIVAFPSLDLGVVDDEIIGLVKQSVEEGADLIGGCPTLATDFTHFCSKFFKLAKELDVDIDFHVDEMDEPCSDVLEHLAEMTIKENYQGRVTAGHCCSLSALTEEDAERIIEKVKDAALNIVTLPSCNLFLMGRQDKGFVRRGITRVNQLMDAGVNVSASSDNIRDPFRPFGNADVLEELLLTAQLTRMSTEQELQRVLAMGTINPAKAMRLRNYGVKEGCKADLVVLDAFSAEDAIISQSEKNMVFKNGKLIVTNSRQTNRFW